MSIRLLESFAGRALTHPLSQMSIRLLVSFAGRALTHPLRQMSIRLLVSFAGRALTHPLSQMSIQGPNNSLTFYNGKGLRDNDEFHLDDMLL